mmetsp:Transcript_26812/g.23677  ORF Transcript_26812/g.23677 Transcript_26812/m.23677 type:complete len:249 (+) Transcript_26812:402-1148(+)
MTDMSQLRKKFLSKLITVKKDDQNVMEPAKNYQIKENFDIAVKVLFGKHMKFLDVAFETVINQPYPVPRFNLWKDLGKEYNTSFENIKKVEKLSKYRKIEFIKENNLTEFDLIIASLEPSKKQFEFLKNVFIKREIEIKSQTKDALDHLLKAKEILHKSGAQMLALSCLMTKSKCFKNEQVLKSRVIKDTFMKKRDVMREIWKIKKEPRFHTIDLAQDPLMGEIVKKHLDKQDHILKFESNHFYFEDS